MTPESEVVAGTLLILLRSFGKLTLTDYYLLLNIASLVVIRSHIRSIRRGLILLRTLPVNSDLAQVDILEIVVI